MKKIFYKIFMWFCIAAYFPLLMIYIFNFFYIDKYIVEEKKNTLIKVAETIDVERLKVIKKEDLKVENSKDDVYLRYIDFNQNDESTDFFKIFNKKEMKIDVKNMRLDEYDIKTVRLSSMTNHFFLIKKISDHEIVAVIGEIIVSKVLTTIIFGIYKQYTMIIIPILLIGSYIVSKKFSEPIETLEKISTQISNSDFTEKIEIKSKNELGSLGDNINKMARQLQSNIKELSQLNEQLKKELKLKEKLLETEKTFMRAIGHELKTPVAIINGYIEALQDGMIEENEIQETYNIIYKEGMSISKLVKDINSYLKLEFQNQKLVYEEIDLKSFIQESLEKYKLDIEQRGIHLYENLSHKIIKSDMKLFNMILNNLFTNALTYVDDRKIIEIDLNEKSLKIANSSEEITQEAIEKIFNPFFKIDKSRNRKYGGSGLGLSIVKNLLEILNLKYEFIYDKDRKFVVFNIKFL